MRYGFYLPTRGPTATRDGILALAREGERLGLHSAMIADHIVFPVESQSPYPYTVDGKHPSVGDALETFSILGVVAGATERLRLVTSVLVLALSQSGADREDGGLAGCLVRRPADIGHRHGLVKRRI
jgi:alkanesulfonate monooxygenase SsuD/methylene tetrahydromethanopterin reductase-like flavin-dependent oxidoreductase (luciferase family)